MADVATLATINGPTAVKAVLTDHLAIHKTLEPKSREWRVSHRRSGLAIAGASTRRECLDIANTLERECGDDLRALDRLQYAQTPNGRGRQGQAAKRIRDILDAIDAGVRR